MYRAQILKDSVAPNGVRLTTIEVEYPHAVHKDIMTHRAFSRNFQSFRAMPPEDVIAKIEEDPFIPETFNSRVKGMHQGDELDKNTQEVLRLDWMTQIDSAIDIARNWLSHDVAKQQINFLLQDFTWIKGIITATEWDNFWGLRADVIDPNAQPRPEVKIIAQLMKKAYTNSEPQELQNGEWHRPLVFPEDEAVLDERALNLLSAGRCARVSYDKHSLSEPIASSLSRAEILMKNGHWSPVEHIATPGHEADKFSGNFRGWVQLRKLFDYESNFADLQRYR